MENPLKLLKIGTKRNSSNEFISSIECQTNPEQNISLVQCGFNIALYFPELFNKSNIDFPIQIQKSVTKRQAEFLAGRIAAREALLTNGVYTAQNFTINIGDHRAPVWPNGHNGSISHSNNSAMCVVGNNNHVENIGIDIAEIIAPETANQIAYQIHDDSELTLLSTYEFSSNLATTIIFSAKESLFKALYPRVKKYFGFECAKLSNVEIHKNVLTMTLEEDFALNHALTRSYDIFFDISEYDVKTLLVCPIGVNSHM